MYPKRLIYADAAPRPPLRRLRDGGAPRARLRPCGQAHTAARRRRERRRAREQTAQLRVATVRFAAHPRRRLRRSRGSAVERACNGEDGAIASKNAQKCIFVHF